MGMTNGIQMFTFYLKVLLIMFHFVCYQLNFGACVAQTVWQQARAGQLGFDSWQGQESFLFSTASRLSTQPPI
jgi:hypothetical protein